MSIEAMKQALECLESLQGGCTDSDDGTVEAITVWCPEVIEALRTAIQQAESEPVCDVFWRVALVRSSHTPDQLIPWLCASPKAAATAEAHSSFIRWLTPRTHPAPGVPDDVVKDADRLDWLARNPVDALDIFGKSRPDEAQFIRATIDAAIAKAKGEA